MESVHVIVGLGNPGPEYAQTRHNAGFMVVDKFAARHRAVWNRRSRFQASVARAESGRRQLVLCKPETFMNLSGTAVQAVLAYYKAPVGQLLVVVDDADLPLGGIRLRTSGSSGGHHGLQSVEQHLGTREYTRARIGIGRRADGRREITDYVLARFAASERALVHAVLERACDQIDCWLSAGPAKAMSLFNGTIDTPLVNES